MLVRDSVLLCCRWINHFSAPFVFGLWTSLDPTLEHFDVLVSKAQSLVVSLTASARFL